MIVDRNNTRWIMGTTAGALATMMIYGIYALWASNGPRGGTAMGLIFGSAGLAIIVFECLLSWRKKVPASPVWPVKKWVRAHVWLGLLSFLLILCHSGFRWGHGLAAGIMWMFLILTLSGVYGLVLQNYIPRRMSQLVSRETIYEEIPNIIRQLRLDASARVEFVTADLHLDDEEADFMQAGGVKRHFDPQQKAGNAQRVAEMVKKRKESPQIAVADTESQALQAHYLQEMRPYLTEQPPAFSRRLFDTPEKVHAYFSYLRTLLPQDAHQVVNDLEQICEERRQLLVQARLHDWLHGWLFVHVPLSFAFLLLAVVHAVMALRW